MTLIERSTYWWYGVHCSEAGRDWSGLRHGHTVCKRHASWQAAQAARSHEGCCQRWRSQLEHALRILLHVGERQETRSGLITVLYYLLGLVLNRIQRHKPLAVTAQAHADISLAVSGNAGTTVSRVCRVRALYWRRAQYIGPSSHAHRQSPTCDCILPMHSGKMLSDLLVMPAWA